MVVVIWPVDDPAVFHGCVAVLSEVAVVVGQTGYWSHASLVLKQNQSLLLYNYPIRILQLFEL